MQRTVDHDIDAVLRSPEGAWRRDTVFRTLNEEAVPLSLQPGGETSQNETGLGNSPP